ncbi:MAG: UDP-N-acetylmuramyl-tripeptide synthetase [Candidatus Magasanikbacteria bacterium]|nr:UDP-N-acetylmuramyl-tripeptide synthetase [Candidatus Magasanikbacteria bacterium]
MLTKLKRLGHWFIAIGAYWFYGRPSRHLVVIGVTGTKGKSSTCSFIASVLKAGGFKVGLLSTIEIEINNEIIRNKNQMTMLGRGQIQKYLARMLKAGCQYAVIETSSEGILQHRHLGLNYDIVVFTNLGSEHHERHGGFLNLKRDKGKIFAGLERSFPKILGGRRVKKTIIANVDSSDAEYFLKFSAAVKLGFSIKNANPGASALCSQVFTAKNISSHDAGADFEVFGNRYHLEMLGEFNIYNALPAIAIGDAIGLAPEQIKLGLNSVKQILGRLQFINVGQPFSFVVDYAHEVISLTALFNALRPLVKPPGKLIGIIGSDGGGRDKSKRFNMGAVAGELCDYVIITDVNPWDEDSEEIAQMLAAGVRSSGQVDNKNLHIIIDRRAAIKESFNLAGVGGVVALTAKGTETAIIGKNGQRLAWDDAGIATELLRRFLNN